jgi:hypothetical protein
MEMHLASWDPEVQASVDYWRRSHRRVVIIMGVLYLLTLAIVVYEGWVGKIQNVLVCLPIIFFPTGVPFFGYLIAYLRAIRILAFGQLVPANRVEATSWLTTSVYTYEIEGKTFSSMRYLTDGSHAKRVAVPVAFVDPSNSKRAIIVLVGGERR